MSYQLYFLQDEDDALQFIKHLARIDAVIWDEGMFRSPSEMEDIIIKQMSSCMRQYLIAPKEIADHHCNARNATVGNVGGISFLICNKGNPQSCTYNIGRIYYQNDTCNPHNAQMIALYKKLKTYIRKSYCYRKQSMIYCAPSFQKRYEEGCYDAEQLGQIIIV